MIATRRPATKHIQTRLSKPVRANTSDLVAVASGEPTTTSIIVAEKFGKLHKNVLQAIQNLECSEHFARLNFQPSEYTDATGRTLPAYRITRDGFAFLAMGFTGKDAAAWKEKFIVAFNWQADEINRLRQMHASPDWHQARIEGKTARRDETDVIAAFVEYATRQGSKSASRYYTCLTKETNRTLFLVKSAVGKDFRQGLSAQQLASLAMAERIVERSLLESMAAKTFYKDAYRATAERIRQFAALIGQSAPGRTSDMLEAAK